MHCGVVQADLDGLESNSLLRVSSHYSGPTRRMGIGVSRVVVNDLLAVVRNISSKGGCPNDPDAERKNKISQGKGRCTTDVYAVIDQVYPERTLVCVFQPIECGEGACGEGLLVYPKVRKADFSSLILRAEAI
jgi:hypothetical protein